MACKSHFLAAIALSAALSGCVSAGDTYPSLAIRDAERITGSAQAVEAPPPPPPAPVSESSAQRIAQAVAQARKAHGDFTATSAGASRTVAAAHGVGAPGDAWIAAQVALADLQSLRSEAMIAQADLDRMYAEERLADSAQVTPTAQALAEAREQVGGWVDEQNRVIERLAGQLRG